MTSTTKKPNLHLGILVMLLMTSGGDGYSCPYGQQCGYEPAPPGRSPPCAQPGLTYCLNPEPYPEHVIHKLIEAGQYDIRTLLTDESQDDFDSKKKGNYPYGYGPNSLPHVDQISLVNDALDSNVYQKDINKFNGQYNPGVFADKTPLQPPSPIDPSPYNNVYLPSNYSKNGLSPSQLLGTSYWNRLHMNHYDYTKKGLRNPAMPQQSYNHGFLNEPFYDGYDADWYRQPDGADSVSRYNPNEWWKYITQSRSEGVTIQRSVSLPTHTATVRRSLRRRNADLVKAAAQRTLTGAQALRIALGLANEDSPAERPRRQTRDNVEELCRVRTQFITPRAALNNKGNWRYVVNMAVNMTQLVRAEICVSTECNGLCTIPLGYSSRCEQKYIQKRLIALETSGQTLYTDLFWIPSCCQCTIVSDN